MSERLFTQHPVTLRYYLVSRTFNSIAAVKHSTPLQLQTSTMKHAISKLFLTVECKSVTLTNSLKDQQAKYFVSINVLLILLLLLYFQATLGADGNITAPYSVSHVSSKSVA